MSVALLEKMVLKLTRIQNDFNNLNVNCPRNGHGGTPNIVDSSKGRLMMRAEEKRQERLRSLYKQENEQLEKIERMKSRILFKKTITKNAKKFLEKNEISPLLFELEKKGIVKQWTRNPMYFFVNGLDKVAIATFDGVICACKRFPVKNEIEKIKVLEIIKLASLEGGM